MNHHANVEAASQSALGRATAKQKGMVVAHHASSSSVVDAADDSADDYQESDNGSEYEQMEEMEIETPADLQRPPPRPMPEKDKDSLRRKREEQVGFIILTSDNNKPDPYGTVSETNGPLPWSAVAKAYNERYGKSIAWAAMEKRVRQGRAVWMEKHPRYPSKIFYSQKVKEHYPEAVVAFARSGGTIGNRKQNHNFLELGNLQDGVVPNDPYNDCIRGWIPPDHIRNLADLHNYADEALSTLTNKVSIDVYDNQQIRVGSVIADREDVCINSPVLGQLLDNNTDTQVQLHCWPLGLIEHYAECVSFRGPAQLPKPIFGDAASVIELYCFAAQVQDGHVRGLVLDHWRGLLRENAEINLELEDLNLLFNNTELDDPARKFWTATVCMAGLADRVLGMNGCHYALIADSQEMMACGS
ncbi:hypothetical protein CFE70_004325 [Pyrenophora teres f. teres 0-1]|nr:hypothetical protein PTNB85_04363 [Pyrenophora teres f. teres]KAE8848898.1 hypothetical protein HRS9122_02914 [Pyrenophora teres f. teres]KAE8867250.1 hypothetical protein PTNB73_05344 [Pyrenophora teres f. teres]